MSSEHDDRNPKCSATQENHPLVEVSLPSGENGLDRRVGIKSMFSLMNLPVEIRLQIYESLLLLPYPIAIPSKNGTPVPDSTISDEPISQAPRLSILKTCKLVNQEATPIFYSNSFMISLPLGLPFKISQIIPDIAPTIATDITTAPTETIVRSHFILSNFRWSTIQYMSSLSFISSINMSLRAPTPAFPTTPRARFTCSGQDIIGRFTKSDVRYSPTGPDDFMALSINNWVSMQVTRAELTAFQKELETMSEFF